MVYFSELSTVYFTHGRRGGVELQLRDGDGSWPKNATRVKLVSRTLQNPAPYYARVKILPFLPISAALALAGYQA